MFEKLFNRKQSYIDREIDKLTTLMNTVEPTSNEYATFVKYVERLNQLKTDNRHRRVSPDTMAIVLGNIAGILVIVAYEQKHVMVSKGLQFVIKAREPHISN